MHFTFEKTPLTSFYDTGWKYFATIWPQSKGGDTNDQKISEQQVVASDSGNYIARNIGICCLYGKDISRYHGMDLYGFHIHDRI